VNVSEVVTKYKVAGLAKIVNDETCPECEEWNELKRESFKLTYSCLTCGFQFTGTEVAVDKALEII
jgi:ribosomal protein L37AE/L43A